MAVSNARCVARGERLLRTDDFVKRQRRGHSIFERHSCPNVESSGHGVVFQHRRNLCEFRAVGQFSFFQLAERPRLSFFAGDCDAPSDVSRHAIAQCHTHRDPIHFRVAHGPAQQLDVCVSVSVAVAVAVEETHSVAICVDPRERDIH